MGQALEMCKGCETPRDCDICTDLYEWIMEHMEPRWISVEDRIPPLYQNVIVNVHHTKKWRDGVPCDYPWNRVEEDIWLGDEWCNNDDTDFRKVTHWMPMPEPPEEDDDDDD